VVTRASGSGELVGSFSPILAANRGECDSCGEETFLCECCHCCDDCCECEDEEDEEEDLSRAAIHFQPSTHRKPA